MLPNMYNFIVIVCWSVSTTLPKKTKKWYTIYRWPYSGVIIEVKQSWAYINSTHRKTYINRQLEKSIRYYLYLGVISQVKIHYQLPYPYRYELYTCITERKKCLCDAVIEIIAKQLAIITKKIFIKSYNKRSIFVPLWKWIDCVLMRTCLYIQPRVSTMLTQHKCCT